MKKILQENKNDWFINLYEQGLFVKSYEYSAMKIAEITGYRLMADIDKKSWMIYLTCAFPENKKNIIIAKLELEKINVRIKSKKWWTEEIYNWISLDKDNDKIIELKKSLVIFD